MMSSTNDPKSVEIDVIRVPLTNYLNQTFAGRLFFETLNPYGL